MGDLLGSLTKPYTVVVRWLNGDNSGWKGSRGAQWRALDLLLRGDATGGIRACTPAGSVPTRTSGPKGVGL